MIADFGPSGVGTDFDSFDLAGPVLREEDVADVVGTVLVVPEIVGGLSFLAWDSEKKRKRILQRGRRDIEVTE